MKPLALVLALCLPSYAGGQVRPWGSYIARVSAQPGGAALAKALNFNFTAPGPAQGALITALESMHADVPGFTPEAMPAAPAAQKEYLQKYLAIYAQASTYSAREAMTRPTPEKMRAAYAELAVLNAVLPALPADAQVKVSSARQSMAKRIAEDTRAELEAKVLQAVAGWEKNEFAALTDALKAPETADPNKAAFLAKHALAKSGALESKLGPLQKYFDILRRRKAQEGSQAPSGAGLLKDAAAVLGQLHGTRYLTSAERLDAFEAYASALYSLELLPAAARRTDAGLLYEDRDQSLVYNGISLADALPGQGKSPETALGEYLAELRAKHPRGAEIPSSEKRGILKEAARLAARYSPRDPPREQRALGEFLTLLMSDGYLRAGSVEFTPRGLFYTDSAGGSNSYSSYDHAFVPAQAASLAVLKENAAFLGEREMAVLLKTLAPAPSGNATGRAFLALRQDSKVLALGNSKEAGRGERSRAAVAELVVRRDGLILDSALSERGLEHNAWRDFLQAIDRHNAAITGGLSVASHYDTAVKLAQNIRVPSTAFEGMGGRTRASFYANRRTGAFIDWANGPGVDGPDVTQVNIVYEGGTSRIAEVALPSETSSFHSHHHPLTAQAHANLAAAVSLVNQRK